MRTDQLEKDGPENGVERDFIPSRRIVDGPQPQAALQPQQYRQCAGHEEQVIEMKPQESTVRVGLESPTVQDIQGTANQEQTIAEIPKPFHNKTRIAKPNAVATSSFKTKIMLTTLPHLWRDFQNIFLT
jgi:hypothetical protein